MLKNEPIILVGVDMIVSDLAVSPLCSVGVLAGTWAGPVMNPIGARIEAAVEALTEVRRELGHGGGVVRRAAPGGVDLLGDDLREVLEVFSRSGSVH